MVKILKSELKLTTQLYNSDWSDLFAWNEQIQQRKGRRRKLARFQEDEYSTQIPTKLMNCSKENDAYKQLREAANIPNLEKDTLALQVIDPYSKQLASIKQNRKENYDASPNKFERCNCSMVHIDTKIKIINLLRIRRWSYGSVCSKFSLQLQQVKWVESHFDSELFAQNQQRKIENFKMKRILKDEQIEWLSDYICRMNDRRIIARNVKLAIEDQFPEIRNISLSTVTRALKQRVRMSYKKLHRRDIGTFRRANIIKYIDSAWIVQNLVNAGWELIYFDGFGWDSRRSQFYGWSKKGHAGYVKMFNDKLDINFIWAISQEWFYGVMGVNGTTDSKSIIKFIEEVWEYRRNKIDMKNKKFILVSDNASVNVWEEVSNFILSSGLRMMTIPPYWLAMNPAEKVINWIKTKVKEVQSKNK